MRSVVVVLPASTCAMIPMLRVRASGTARGSAACFIAMSSEQIAGRGVDDRRQVSRRSGVTVTGSMVWLVPPFKPRAVLRLVRPRLLLDEAAVTLPAVVRERLV